MTISEEIFRLIEIAALGCAQDGTEILMPLSRFVVVAV
jgi:hypothetical protein